MRKILPYLAFLSFLSCDHGLELPPAVEPGFGGVLYFAHGTWPPSDSLQNLWLFASQIYPLDSTSIFRGLGSQIFVYPPGGNNLQPFNVDSISYSFLLPPATYKYIGVIQHTRLELFDIRSYRIVGVYMNPSQPGMPGSVTVRDYEFVQGINVYADFYNPPPQPF